jgi:hypothetical protein
MRQGISVGFNSTSKGDELRLIQEILNGLNPEKSPASFGHLILQSRDCSSYSPSAFHALASAFLPLGLCGRYHPSDYSSRETTGDCSNYTADYRDAEFTHAAGRRLYIPDW